MSSSYKEGLSLICDTNVSSARIWHRQEAVPTPFDGQRKQEPLWVLDKSLWLPEALTQLSVVAFRGSMSHLRRDRENSGQGVAVSCFSSLAVKCIREDSSDEIDAEQQSQGWSLVSLDHAEQTLLWERALKCSFFILGIQTQNGWGVSKLPQLPSTSTVSTSDRAAISPTGMQIHQMILLLSYTPCSSTDQLKTQIFLNIYDNILQKNFKKRGQWGRHCGTAS